ncbi:MAG: yuxL, partial [Rhodoglobus sp.]|nr:yuxL [Rhodoglobus sp.]
MKAADLDLLVGVSTPTVHPGGGRAVVSVMHPSLSADATVGQLWTIPLSGHAAPKLFTRGFRDTAPRFSPDGRLLAFLRAEAKRPPQLYVVDAAGGEPVAVTDRTLGVTEFAWSPDGRTLAFVSREPQQGRYGTVEGIDPNGEPARRIDSLKYQANGLGYTIDRRAHVFVVTAPDVWAPPSPAPAPLPDGSTDGGLSLAEPRQLTDGPWDDGSISFSPDGKRIAFVSARHASRDVDLRSNVFTVAVEGGDARDLTGQHGSYSVVDAQYANNGVLFFTAQDVGETGRDFVGRNTALYVIGADGQAPRLLSDPETVDFTESDIAAYRDDAVLVHDRRRGALVLTEVTAAGDSRRLTDDQS